LTNLGLNNPKLGALRIEGKFPAPGTYQVSVCTKCGQCRDACPVDAIKQQKDGSFRVEAAECTGCQACVDACPEGVTRFVPEKNVAFVCLNCGECVKYCPREALVDEDGEVKRV
jgi:ferredoxin